MQEEKVDSNDDEISPLEESSISPEDKDDEILNIANFIFLVMIFVPIIQS